MATMTDPRGGYRPPQHPAPASGPGARSRRTDGGPGQPIKDLPNPDYGEAQTFRSAQQMAPMDQAPGAPAAPPQQQVSPPDLSGVVGLGAPTQRPGEPVTAGAATGAGPGPDAMALPVQDAGAIQYLKNSLPTLEIMAGMPQASSAFRQFVRRVRAAG